MDVNSERFKYLVANQSVWAEMYRKKKEIEKEEYRIKHAKYNINYKPIWRQTNKNKLETNKLL
jgi:hypothetical protein